jgi:DNA-binding NarL/FixJ family response regulator
MNVFVLDAHAIYRRGLVRSLAVLPEVDSIAEAGSLEEARLHPQLPRADVVVVDHDSPGTHELIREVSATGGARVVVCSSRCSQRDVIAATRSGAVGVLSKTDLTPERLIGAVRASAQGAGVLVPAPAERVVGNGHVERAPRVPSAQALTARERRVLSLIAEGRQTREVARELSYSERTVKNVLHDAATKLHARSRSQAVASAVRSGLI